MKIEIAKPPMFAEIVRRFPLAAGNGVIFAWGDTIYNPSGIVIPDALVAHEQAHGEEQLRIGVERWWDEYLRNPGFRYEQELLGHKAELIAQLRDCGGDRNRKAKLLQSTARRLIAPLYEYGLDEVSTRSAMLDLTRSLQGLYEP